MAATYQVGIIVGSLRKDSFNAKFAHALIKLAPAEFSFKFLTIGDLPLYNQDDDANPAEAVKRFKSEIRAMQGILFVTPEYNRSLPGVLKNALDHGSRPYGASAWAGKPAAIIGTSQANTATAIAQQHLRIVLSYLDMHTMHQPEGYIQYRDSLIDADGNIGTDSKEFLQKWVNAFVAWIKRHAT